MAEKVNGYAVNASAMAGDPREAAAAARKSGFAGLLFDAYSSGLTFTDLSGTGRREFLRMLEGQNQRLVGLRVELGTKGFGPGADVDRLLAQAQQVMETAAGLQSRLICLEMGALPEALASKRIKPKITAEQAGFILIPSFPEPEVEEPAPVKTPQELAFESQVDSAMVALGALADRYSVTVALHSDLSSFAAIERVLQSARCPWYGVNHDPVSVLRDQWDMDEIFARLGSLIFHVRARDAVVGADRRTKPAVIGRGDTKWDHLLDNLEAANYHQWITFDSTELTDRAGAAVAGMKYLKLHESL